MNFEILDYIYTYIHTYLLACLLINLFFFVVDMVMTNHGDLMHYLFGDFAELGDSVR